MTQLQPRISCFLRDRARANRPVPAEGSVSGISGRDQTCQRWGRSPAASLRPTGHVSPYRPLIRACLAVGISARSGTNVSDAPAAARDEVAHAVITCPIRVVVRAGGVELIDELANQWRTLCEAGSFNQPFIGRSGSRRTSAPSPGTRGLLVVTARRGEHLRAVLPLIHERTWRLARALAKRLE